MEKLSLLLITLIISISGFSQVHQLVDEKNGFLEFKFGKKPSDFQGKIQKIANNFTSKNMESYIVKSKDYEKVFGIDVEKITLRFFKNQLFEITIAFEKKHDNDVYDLLLYKLQNIFGIKYLKIAPEESEYRNYLQGSSWDGNNTILQLINYKIKYASLYSVDIYYKNLILEKQMDNNEF